MENIKQNRITTHDLPAKYEHAGSTKPVPLDVKPVCDICKKSFGNMDSLKRHKIALHSQIRDYKCNMCEYAASRKYQLNNHTVKIHGHELSGLADTVFVVVNDFTIGSKELENGQGPLSIANEMSVKIEPKELNKGNSRTKSESHSCDLCGLNFATKGAVLEHKKNAHFNIKECSVFLSKINPKYEKKYSPNVSKRDGEARIGNALASKGKTIPAVDLEKSSSSNVKDFRCDTCGYVSREKSKIEIHKRAVHDKIKDQYCDVCDKAFFHSQSMNRHMRRVHGKVKDYICNLCEHQVSTKLMLKVHKLNAHGEDHDIRYFKCEICKYSTYEKSRLTIHLRAVHDRIKSHMCDICNQAFAHSQTLNRHKQSESHKKKVHNKTQVDMDEELDDSNKFRT